METIFMVGMGIAFGANVVAFGANVVAFGMLIYGLIKGEM